jgi:PHD/YefM family antitoxin component YafN of YafNO toxin-antitoxin module
VRVFVVRASSPASEQGAKEPLMLKIKPEIWTKSSGEQFVVLSLADFEKMQEGIEDAGLSRILRVAKRKEANAATTSLTDVKKTFRANVSAKP